MPQREAKGKTRAPAAPLWFWDFLTRFHWAWGSVHTVALLPGRWSVIDIWIAEVLQQLGNSLGLHSKSSIYSGWIKTSQTLGSSSITRGSLLADLLALG